MMPSAQRIQANLDRLAQEMVRFTKRNMKQIVAKRTEEEAVHLASLSDHSLEDLRRMGHPYRKGASPNQPHPDYLIHRQSLVAGAGLADSFVSEIKAEGSQISFVLRNTADEWPYLRDGTETMRQRPLHVELASRVQNKIGPEFFAAQRRAFGRLKLNKT